MELPVARIRQITEAIYLRHQDLDGRQRAYLEWQTRVLTHIQVATNPHVTDSGRSQLHAEIDRLRILAADEPEAKEPEIEYRMVRGEKIPVRYNRTEAVDAGLLPGLTRPR